MENSLLTKYQSIIETKSPYKYYHFKTTYNLIIHLKELPEGKKKEEMFNALHKYLDYIQANEVVNVSESIENYNVFLRPIALYFDKKLGFVYFSKWHILLLLIPSVIIGYFISSIYAYALIFILDILIVRYYQKKYKNNATYGVMW